MMHTGSYDILFSESQPEIFLKHLLAVLQAETNLSAIKASLSLLKILVIDINEVRADAIAQLIHAAGYKSIIFPTALDALTPDAFPYMAPERWHGQALPASDQYALACIAYELLAGRPPFQGQSEYTMRFLHLNMRPQAPVTFSSALPPAINHVLLQGMAKRPEDRFPSVMAFANALQRYCS